MRIGALNRQIIIERLSGEVDGLGQSTGEWEPYAVIWVNIRHLSGLESIRAGAQSAVNKASIRGRYRRDITTAMRARHGDTVYAITAVLPDEQRREYVDLTVETVA